MPQPSHRFYKSLILVTIVALSSGCAGGLRAPLMGAWYSDLRSGVAATSNPSGNLVGEACASSILGLVATGDASIEAARRNGRITQISAVDEHSTSILGIYATYCTTVRGK